MSAIILIAIVLVIVIFLARLDRPTDSAPSPNQTGPPIPSNKVPSLDEAYSKRAFAEHDAKFEATIAEEFVGQIEKSFYSKIAGTTHRNRDGTYRKPAIAKCEEGERLSLVHEPDNPVDPNAIAICTEDGFQLGYIEARLAGEIIRDVARNGPRWVVTFAHHNCHPETGKVVGGTIYVTKLH